jgi:hypothetical protein
VGLAAIWEGNEVGTFIAMVVVGKVGNSVWGFLIVLIAVSEETLDVLLIGILGTLLSVDEGFGGLDDIVEVRLSNGTNDAAMVLRASDELKDAATVLKASDGTIDAATVTVLIVSEGIKDAAAVPRASDGITDAATVLMASEGMIDAETVLKDSERIIIDAATVLIASVGIGIGLVITIIASEEITDAATVLGSEATDAETVLMASEGIDAAMLTLYSEGITDALIVALASTGIGLTVVDMTLPKLDVADVVLIATESPLSNAPSVPGRPAVTKSVSIMVSERYKTKISLTGRNPERLKPLDLLRDIQRAISNYF